MVWAIVAVVLTLMVLVLLANVVAVRATLRPPRTPMFLTPREMGIPYLQVAFPTRDGLRLHGWWMPAKDAVAIAILCHGYLMNRCEPLPVARELWHAGFHCLVFDFRASGKSQGDLCTIGDKERLDVISAVDFVTQTAPGLPVVVYGASMGGAASLLAAAEDPRIRAVVADSAYARLDVAVDDWWRSSIGRLGALFLRPTKWIGALVTRKLPHTVSPEAVVHKIAPRPILIVHGTRDQLIQPRHAERLYRSAGEPKSIWWAEGSEHVQARFDHPDQFFPLIVQFFKESIGLCADGQPK
ncbi:MAG: alpha/beta hydrolase [Fimbriimonadales bacterium]